MILFDRLGISGAGVNTAELIEIVSEKSVDCVAYCDDKVLRLVWVSELWPIDDGYELYPPPPPDCMLTEANTEKSWADDDTLAGGGDCSPSLVFNCTFFWPNVRVPDKLRVPELLLLWRFGLIPGDFSVNSGHLRG